MSNVNGLKQLELNPKFRKPKTRIFKKVDEAFEVSSIRLAILTHYFHMFPKNLVPLQGYLFSVWICL